eukprot:538988-Pyramimonas_sp.AAC.1
MLPWEHRDGYYSSDIDPTLSINMMNLAGVDWLKHNFMSLVSKHRGSDDNPGAHLHPRRSDM